VICKTIIEIGFGVSICFFVHGSFDPRKFLAGKSEWKYFWELFCVNWINMVSKSIGVKLFRKISLRHRVRALTHCVCATKAALRSARINKRKSICYNNWIRRALSYPNQFTVIALIRSWTVLMGLAKVSFEDTPVCGLRASVVLM